MSKKVQTTYAELTKINLVLHPRAAEAYSIWASVPSLIRPSRARTEALKTALGSRALVAAMDPSIKGSYQVVGGFEAFKLCSVLLARGVDVRVNIVLHPVLMPDEASAIVAQEIVALALSASDEPRQTDWVRAAIRASGRKASLALTGQSKWTDAGLDRLVGRQSRSRTRDPFAYFGSRKSPNLFEAIRKRMVHIEYDRPKVIEDEIMELEE